LILQNFRFSGNGQAGKFEIVDGVSGVNKAFFELGFRQVAPAQEKARIRMTVLKKWFRIEILENFQCIRFAIRGDRDAPLRGQLLREQLDQSGLDQPAFFMSFFRPGIGEINVDRAQFTRQE